MSIFHSIEKDPAAICIREAAAKETLSHALFFTGSSDLIAAAHYAAAALECKETHNRPCGNCSACRKILRDIHPDVTIVCDNEHTMITADVIRNICSDSYIRPNEGKCKVYIFPDCSLLPERDQNMLLKIVEEGPPYAAFIFCMENPSSLLRTLRSRCVEYRFRPKQAVFVSEDGEKFCRAMLQGKTAEEAVHLERKRLTNQELQEMLAWCWEASAAALLSLYGRQPEDNLQDIVSLFTKRFKKDKIAFIVDMFKKYYNECASRVGSGHILGALTVELEHQNK